MSAIIMTPLQVAVLALVRLRAALRRADGSAELLRAPAIEALESIQDSRLFWNSAQFRRRLWSGELGITHVGDAIDALGQDLLDEELAYELEPEDSERRTDPVLGPHGEEALAWYTSLATYEGTP